MVGGEGRLQAPHKRPDAPEYTHRAFQRKRFVPGSVGRVVRTAGFVIGALATAAGLIWLLQGLNVPFAPRSFMTADRTWVAVGAVTAFAGVALLTWSRRHS